MSTRPCASLSQNWSRCGTCSTRCSSTGCTDVAYSASSRFILPEQPTRNSTQQAQQAKCTKPWGKGHMFLKCGICISPQPVRAGGKKFMGATHFDGKREREATLQNTGINTTSVLCFPQVQSKTPFLTCLFLCSTHAHSISLLARVHGAHGNTAHTTLGLG